MQLPVILLSALALASSQGVRTPTAETEGISVDAPATFVVGNRSNDGRINLVELVRPPETVDTWSELISVVTIMHATEGTTLNEFYPMWRDGYRGTCPGPNEAVARGTVDGRPALKATFHCPVDPQTGKPESLTVIFIQGEVNLLSVQLAFRRSMTNADLALVQKVQKTLKVCDARDNACFARRATGFMSNG